MEQDRFARARILLEQNRYDLATREITARLQDDPNDPDGYILLTLCQVMQQKREALETCRRAVELAPDNDRVHYVMSLSQKQHGDLAAAEASIRRAIGLNSWNAGYFGQLAAIELERHRWRAGLEAADEGLAIDPDDELCLNLRAAALTKLGRHKEAAQTLEGALEKHPEDAYSHANRGWSLLHENDPNRAIVHFRESLRLDPNSSWAKEGLLDALRARYWFYRRVLQFFLWMARFPPGVQFGLLIGAVIGVRALTSIARANPDIAPFLFLIIIGYVAFVAATWFALHFMNILLLMNPDGRLLVERNQRIVSSLCVLLVLGALGLAIRAILYGDLGSTFAAIALFLIAVHFASVMNIPFGQYRWLGLAASVVIMLVYSGSKINRLELEQQWQALLQRADAFDAELDRIRPGLDKLPESEQEQIKKERSLVRASLETEARKLNRQSEDLQFWESLGSFGSLGVLFLHSALANRARRNRFASSE